MNILACGTELYSLHWYAQNSDATMHAFSESTNQADIAVMAIFLHSRKRKAFHDVRQTEETAYPP